MRFSCEQEAYPSQFSPFSDCALIVLTQSYAPASIVMCKPYTKAKSSFVSFVADSDHVKILDQAFLFPDFK